MLTLTPCYQGKQVRISTEYGEFKNFSRRAKNLNIILCKPDENDLQPSMTLRSTMYSVIQGKYDDCIKFLYEDCFDDFDNYCEGYELYDYVSDVDLLDAFGDYIIREV